MLIDIPRLCAIHYLTLQSLCIYNWSNTIDLAPLFDSLIFLPSLNSIFLSGHVDTPLPSSLKSLHRFIHAHKTNLVHLSLAFPASTSDETRLGSWLVKFVEEDYHFPALQALMIYPFNLQICLSAVLTLIKRNAPTLSTLIIPNHYLTLEEAKQVFDALTESSEELQVQVMIPPKKSLSPSKLKILRLNTKHLSVSLLELLARKFPKLENLLWMYTYSLMRFAAFIPPALMGLTYFIASPPRLRPKISCTAGSWGASLSE